ncbi:gamma-glutamyl-gamma-aminobutyrate hydrolase family protein [Lagierella sp.]|uniref:gamma-glutamyl-gamma-aminobutyrate hydrolase family protein n=1 Tax=Lagierella sp. TaxID=2849657 RepID=UPI002608E6A7|nr:gamma-glutamyl-gamma-aminobutyrate hydrolase family protein [Lagierella sp.]
MKVIGTISRYYHGPLYKSAFVKEKTVQLFKDSDIMLISLPITKNDFLIDDILLTLDGLYISGDEEVNPFLFSENPIDNRPEFNIVQDKVELLYIERALKYNIPILATGRGLHLLNIYFGGNLFRSLEQELDKKVYHKGESEKTYHFVTLKNRSLLKDLFKIPRLVVPSNHKQGIKELGEKMRVTAWSYDGIVEAVEPLDENFNYLGLQFNLEDFDEAEGMKILKQFFNEEGKDD